MKAQELNNLGIPMGLTMKIAQKCMGVASKEGYGRTEMEWSISKCVIDPGSLTEDVIWRELALAMFKSHEDRYQPRDEPAPWRQWGENLETVAVEQMETAVRLPVAVQGALMPDAHLGYGLPIGGVLATRNSVIPYAVGMDIACRMKLSVYDIPPRALKRTPAGLATVLEEHTRFGVGAHFDEGDRHNHEVMDDDWSISRVTQKNKDKAWSQLGTSGSGNHFAEFGVFKLEKDDFGLLAGHYLALLTHGGSRGVGSDVARHYSKLACDMHPDLPKDLQSLAWLDLTTAEGQEYWDTMQLMGRYAAANHDLIHEAIARSIGADIVLDIENHHNFAWKEVVGTREAVIHRKGATPAHFSKLGIIPGSMATPAYIVRGKGCAESLNSASHGAGRLMSRTEAKKRFSWEDANKMLADKGVTLLSAGLDEVPMAYKDIEQVMAAQSDLVKIVGVFEPKLVKMAPVEQRRRR